MPLGFDLSSVTNLLNMGSLNGQRPTAGIHGQSDGAGSKVDRLGRPMSVRGSKTAINNFGLDHWNMDTRPNPKFLYYVQFIRSNSVGQTQQSNTQKNGNTNTVTTAGTKLKWEDTLGFMVKKVSRPGINFTHETLNQYNKQRLVQTKKEYTEVDMTFHDTRDMRVRTMFEEYYKWYYGDAHKTVPTAWSDDKTSNSFLSDNEGWGYHFNSSNSPNTAPFFSHIIIYQFLNQNKYVTTTLVNPLIINYLPDEMDYSADTDTQEITIKFAYEGLIINSAEHVDNGQLMAQTNLNHADYYEPYNGPIGQNSLANAWTPLRKPASPDILGNLFKDTISAIATGNTKHLGNVLKTSVLGSLGGFSFGGTNGGNNVASSLLTSGTNSAISGSFGGLSGGLLQGGLGLGTNAGLSTSQGGNNVSSVSAGSLAGVVGLGLVGGVISGQGLSMGPLGNAVGLGNVGAGFNNSDPNAQLGVNTGKSSNNNSTLLQQNFNNSSGTTGFGGIPPAKPIYDNNGNVIGNIRTIQI